MIEFCLNVGVPITGEAGARESGGIAFVSAVVPSVGDAVFSAVAVMIRLMIMAPKIGAAGWIDADVSAFARAKVGIAKTGAAGHRDTVPSGPVARVMVGWPKIGAAGRSTVAVKKDGVVRPGVPKVGAVGRKAKAVNGPVRCVATGISKAGAAATME